MNCLWRSFMFSPNAEMDGAGDLRRDFFFPLLRFERFLRLRPYFVGRGWMDGWMIDAF